MKLDDGQEILEGRYEVIKRLNGGAFGEIYRGKYLPALNATVKKKRTGEILAAKVVSRLITADIFNRRRHKNTRGM